MATKGAFGITADTCTQCGACCVGPGDQQGFCDISEEDFLRLPKSFRKNVVLFSAFDLLTHPWIRSVGVIKTQFRKQQAGPLKGCELNMCAALKGSVMHKVSCSIYGCRPDTCKTAVVPGDKSCRMLRKAYKDKIKESKR